METKEMVSGFIEEIMNEITERTAKKILLQTNELINNHFSKKEDAYLTRKEVGKKLKVSMPTLANYCKHKGLNSYIIGNNIRFKESEVDAFLNNRKQL
jgi:excisionase family DNA binding protein